VSEPSTYAATAADVLSRHCYATTNVGLIGAGQQSVCYGTGEVAVLLSRAGAGEPVTGITVRNFLGGGAAVSGNSYAVLQWLTTRAVGAGVRTPNIIAVGEHPRPYALMQRAPGTLASAHPYVEENTATWFGRLGEEIRKVNHVQTSGFGMFVPDGSGGYRGRFPSWADYLNCWLGVHLCVGQSRVEDQKVLDLLLAQRIVTEADLAAVAEKVLEAQEWPVRSVLTHYDNRLDNLVVDRDGITLLDWGLSLAGIGIAQELIKVFEVAPVSMKDPRVAAFLHGYGLSEPECLEAIEGGKLMLVLDGLAMSYGWADQPDLLHGIRAWLHTVKRICGTW
jgi:hypothetical protein